AQQDVTVAALVADVAEPVAVRRLARREPLEAAIGGRRHRADQLEVGVDLEVGALARRLLPGGARREARGEEGERRAGAAARPADRAAAMPVSAGTAPAARLRLRRTHRAVRYAGEPAAAIPRLRGGIVVPAEAVRDEVLPGDVLLADEAAPRNP